MAVACASRFAVLKLEDDELGEGAVSDELNITDQKNNQSGKSKAVNVKSGAPQQEGKVKPKRKKKTSANDVAELQSLAFGTGVAKGKSKAGGQAQYIPRAANEKQWEEWKRKDDEYVSEAYEQDLQQALLLSKIDYEEKKEIYEAFQKENEHHKHGSQNQKKKKKSNQKKEKGTMSLEEFQNLLPSQIDSGNYSKTNAVGDELEIREKPIPVDESDFFDKIEEDAEKIINREQRQESFKRTEPIIESARNLQFQNELEKKDQEIQLLTENVQKLKEELKTVKTRNKKLCSILGAGEMREKAEILIQMEQLTQVKDELTEQVYELHAALEQERSKVHAIQTELKKISEQQKGQERFKVIVKMK